MGHWIAGAIKHKGALRSEMHVKKGKTIPRGQLLKATHSPNKKKAARARLAETLISLHRK